MNSEKVKPKLSIITATYNALDDIPNLVKSLLEQNCKDFEWVVADGCSSDGTLDYLSDIKDIDLKVISAPDFGVYDALNKGLAVSSNEYYLVVGADDYLYPDTVGLYLKAIEESNADIVTSKINVEGRAVGVKGGSALINNQGAYVSGHAIGSVFRKSLHDSFGFYSNRFPIAADHLFIKSVVEGGSKVFHADFVAGEFGTQGLSSRDLLGSLTENFRIQIESRKNIFQLIIYMARLIKNYRKF